MQGRNRRTAVLTPASHGRADHGSPMAVGRWRGASSAMAHQSKLLPAWGLCLGGCHGIRWLVSLPFLGCGCKQNKLWWVWVCQHGCGGYEWLPWLRRREWVLGGCRG